MFLDCLDTFTLTLVLKEENCHPVLPAIFIKLDLVSIIVLFLSLLYNVLLGKVNGINTFLYFSSYADIIDTTSTSSTRSLDQPTVANVNFSHSTGCQSN